jgi:hypothetical protein
MYAEITEVRPTLARDVTWIQTFIVTEDNVLPFNNEFDQPFDMIWVNPCTGVGSIR